MDHVVLKIVFLTYILFEGNHCGGDDNLSVELYAELLSPKRMVVSCVVHMPVSLLPPNTILIEHTTSNFSVTAYTERSDENDCTASIEFTSVSDRRPSEKEAGLTERARSYERYIEGTYCVVNENRTLNRKLIVQVEDPIVFDYEEWRCTVTPGERNSDDIIFVEKPNFDPRLNWLVEFDRDRKDFHLVRNLSLTALQNKVPSFYRTALTCHAPGFTREKLFKNLENITEEVPYTPFGFTFVKRNEPDNPSGFSGNNVGEVYPELEHVVTDLYGRTDNRITEPLEDDYMCPKGGITSFLNTSNSGEETWGFNFADQEKHVRMVCFGNEDDQWITYNSPMATTGLSEEEARRSRAAMCGTFYPIFSNTFRDFHDGGQGSINRPSLTIGPETALYFKHDLFSILPNDCRTIDCPGVDPVTRVIKSIETQTPRFVIQMPRQSEIMPFRISDVNPVFRPDGGTPCHSDETCASPPSEDYVGEGYTTIKPDYRLTKEFYSEFVDMLRLFYRVDIKAVYVRQQIYTGNLESVARRVRDDGRCGEEFLAPNGKIGECDPESNRYCCSPYGWCGEGDLYCGLLGVNYRETEGASKEPSATLTCGDGLDASRIVYIGNSLCRDPLNLDRGGHWCNTEEGRFKALKFDFVPPHLSHSSVEAEGNIHLNSPTITMLPNKGGFFVPGMSCLWRVYLCGTKPRSNVDLLKEVILVDTTEAWNPDLYDVFNVRGERYGFKSTGKTAQTGDIYQTVRSRFPVGYTGFGNKIIQPNRCPYGLETNNREDMWEINHNFINNSPDTASIPHKIPNGIVEGIVEAGTKFPDPRAIKIVSMNRVLNSSLCSCVKIPNTCALPPEYRYFESYRPRKTDVVLQEKFDNYQTVIDHSLGFNQMSMWRFFNVETVGYCEIMGIRSPHTRPVTEILGQLCLEEERFGHLHLDNTTQNGDEFGDGFIPLESSYDDPHGTQPVVNYANDRLIYSSVVLKPGVREVTALEGFEEYYSITCDGLPTECSFNSRFERQNSWEIILNNEDEGLNNVVIHYMIKAGELSDVEIFDNSNGEATQLVLLKEGVWSPESRDTYLNITVQNNTGIAVLVEKRFYHRFQLIRCGWEGEVSAPKLIREMVLDPVLNPHVCEEPEGMTVDITKVGDNLVSCTVRTRGLCNLSPTVSFDALYKIETESKQSERVYDGALTCADYQITRTNLNRDGIYGWCNFENNRKTRLTRSIRIDEHLIVCKVVFPNHKEILHIESLNQLTDECAEKPVNYKPTVDVFFKDNTLTVGCVYPDYLEDNTCNLNENDDIVAMILHLDSSFETRKSVLVGLVTYTGICNVPQFLGFFSSGLEDVQCHTASGRGILTVGIHGPNLYNSIADVVGARVSVSCAKARDIVTQVDLNSTNGIGNIETRNVKEVRLIDWYKQMYLLKMVEEDLNRVVIVKHDPSSRRTPTKHWAHILLINNEHSDPTLPDYKCCETTKFFLGDTFLNLGYAAVGLLALVVLVAVIIILVFLLLLARKEETSNEKKLNNYDYQHGFF